MYLEVGMTHLYEYFIEIQEVQMMNGIYGDMKYLMDWVFIPCMLITLPCW